MYKEFVSRNWLFIDKKEQLRIKNTRILVAGVGMGSFIAELLVRSGFEDIIIADGDTVSLSNLNRQNYTTENIGKNKARSLAKRLRLINKNVKLEVCEFYLKPNDLKEKIKKVDVVINTIDFDSKAFLSCHNLCKKYNKIEFFPINLGFGAAVCVNDKDSIPFQDFFRTKDSVKMKYQIIEESLKYMNSNSLFLDEYSKYKKKVLQNKVEYDPQMGISSFVASSIVVSLIIKNHFNKLKTFPYFYHMDIYNSF